MDDLPAKVGNAPHALKPNKQQSAVGENSHRESIGVNPWMHATDSTGMSKTNQGGFSTTYSKTLGSTAGFSNNVPRQTPQCWVEANNRGPSPARHAQKLKIDQSVKELLSNDLSGLQGDYSEHVQSIVNEKKHKMQNKGLANQVQALKTQLEKDVKVVAELKTISQAIHPTKLSKQLVHQKLESGEYKNHSQNQACVVKF